MHMYMNTISLILVPSERSWQVHDADDVILLCGRDVTVMTSADVHADAFECELNEERATPFEHLLDGARIHCASVVVRTRVVLVPLPAAP